MIQISGWPRALNWDMFRPIAERPEGEEENAQINPTTSPTNLSVDTDDDGKKYLESCTLEVAVNRAQSWVVRGTKTDALLRHEQVHFDIQGLITREILTEFRSMRADTTTELTQELTNVLTVKGARGQTLSDTYDTDTDHGRNQAQQTAWETRVRNAIQNDTTL